VCARASQVTFIFICTPNLLYSTSDSHRHRHRHTDTDTDTDTQTHRHTDTQLYTQTHTSEVNWSFRLPSLDIRVKRLTCGQRAEGGGGGVRSLP
jgi:hypothetical protein